MSKEFISTDMKGVTILKYYISILSDSEDIKKIWLYTALNRIQVAYLCYQGVHPRIVLQHIISYKLGIISAHVLLRNDISIFPEKCVLWGQGHQCALYAAHLDVAKSNRELSWPLVLTGTNHFLNWVVFSTNLPKDSL